MLEHVGLVLGSFLVELLVSPLRLAGWLLAGAVVAVGCAWACLRVGRLFNLGYRPGGLVVVMAVMAACTAGATVVSLQALAHSRGVVDALFLGAPAGREVSARACRVMDSMLDYTGRRTGYRVESLNCGAPAATAVSDPRDAGMAPMHRWLQVRLRRSQVVTMAGAVMLLGVCFAVPSWQAYRGLQVHVPDHSRVAR